MAFVCGIMLGRNDRLKGLIFTRTVNANGLTLPALGMGGWNIGDRPSKTRDEISALRLGLELGMSLIDTAEIYGNGASERLIGRALEGIKREEYLLCSKVLPQNAGKNRIFASCDATLRRLKTDYLDLYLLHWRGAVPLGETVDCMEALVRAGKIRRWGVSNFDVADMEELWALPQGKNCTVNQVLYNLGSRGIEFDLLPWLKARNVAVMAYCPLAQAGALKRMNYDYPTDKTLLALAQKYGASVWQIMLAFVLRRDNVVAIPKAGRTEHVAENAKALGLSIEPADWAEIDRAFPPPTSKMHLDVE